MEISLSDFKINDDGTIEGKIENPELPLITSELKAKNDLKIKGIIRETFQVMLPIHGEIRVPNQKFKAGDWYVKYAIIEGFEFIKEGTVKSLILFDAPTKEGVRVYKPDQNSFLVALKRISALDFSNFYLDIRGGSDAGLGRNEHGLPHFHIILNAGRKDIGKVYFPTVEEYKSTGKELVFSSTLKRKYKNEILDWTFKNDLKNLQLMNDVWELMNQGNQKRMIK
ncbi:MAG: hypothetical protein CMP59_00855 [Flavobacteriales bacterium]|nr:hypothetical protein [Flavobacteriales bacterium]|tara:strand:- start:311 stop:985 length:675 start_codon:yes stop_codon:yes gene_type:complete